jgi:putative PIN family toxin of toxin-antitoxin system
LSRICVVIDTNVLLDCWVFNDPRSAWLWQALMAPQARLRCVRSEATDAELAEVLSRPFFTERMRAAAVSPETLLAQWCSLAAPVERTFSAPWHCTDPQDQKFLDLASSARANIVVSKDKALLRVDRRSRHDGLRIVLPQQALALLPPSSNRAEA